MSPWPPLPSASFPSPAPARAAAGYRPAPGCRRGALPAVATLLAVVVTHGADRTTAAPPPLPHIERAGGITLPERAEADGPLAGSLITGLSGIAWLGGDRYVAVMDNSDRLLSFRLEVSLTGEPERVSDLKLIRLGEQHDYEDVAPCPPLLARRIAERRRARGDRVPTSSLLVCEENTPAIRAVDAESGELLGIVPVPGVFAGRRPNRGLESLAVDPDGRVIWTALEEALPADGSASGEGRGTVVRIARIAVPDAADAPPDAQFAYAVAAPHAFVRILSGEPLAGLVALVALGDGRLLALERAAGPGLPPFKSRITLIDTAAAGDVSAVEADLADLSDRHLVRSLLWEDALGCNLEGLCLGPRLADGRRLLVGVADNGGLGTPNQLVTLRLRDGPPPIDASLLGIAAVVAGLAVFALRLTSPSPCSTR
jgi:hypothetical protein